MPKANVRGIEIEFETIGVPDAAPLLLIAGLGSQMHAWPDEMCTRLADEGFLVIRFDNRDVGLSTKLRHAGSPDFSEINAAIARGEQPRVSYTLEDMANDAVGVLDSLRIAKAHVCGASMGGMIAMAVAYTHPARVSSLAVIMSTTGDPRLPQGRPEILMQFFAPVPSEREAYIDEAVRRDRLIHGRFEFVEAQARAYRTREYDRCYYPEGPARQLAALAVPGNIQPRIQAIRVPTTIIHGSDDPFYPSEVGKAIAESIPGARLVIVEGMGHSFPREVVPRIVDAITENCKRGQDEGGKNSIAEERTSVTENMNKINSLMDDIAIAAFEKKTGVASLALVNDNGKVVYQSKNWDLTTQGKTIVNVINGSKEFVLNSVRFSVISTDPARIVGANDRGLGAVVMMRYTGGCLVAYVIPGASPENVVIFLDQYKNQIAG
ncbi:MAG: alpha/beta hydrolase [Candidatus Lokiarchaeota archaeon]|nr:alpha/beta hydrolase [Candidatus Lokiarchaeota archaeon]